MLWLLQEGFITVDDLTERQNGIAYHGTHQNLAREFWCFQWRLLYRVLLRDVDALGELVNTDGPSRTPQRLWQSRL